MIESKRQRNLRIWHNMTPAQRDYDRFVARQIPEGATWGAETEGGRKMSDEIDRLLDGGGDSECCSCHRCAPCSWCLSQGEDEA